ncbi:MAG: 50S ribosomal protein L19 [Crocinitomicaceae bacterium]|nr:50S ribosomal protein L19 [Crocinitomicaceae bacterium]
MDSIIKEVENELVEGTEVPKFKAGATVTVHYKIKEGNKERVQQFQGIVIQRKGSGATETFTVRKMSGNIGVERIFPIASPFIEKIEVNKVGSVRRSRIYYFRKRRGKAAKIKEKRQLGEENGKAKK